MAATRRKQVAKNTATKLPRRQRKQPGATGEGQYYHVQIRATEEFTRFRTHDVGAKGGIQRIAGQREDGSWDTQAWLIGKGLAHVEQGRLVPDTSAAREVLEELGSEPLHIEGDRFQAEPGTTAG